MAHKTKAVYRTPIESVLIFDGLINKAREQADKYAFIGENKIAIHYTVREIRWRETLIERIRESGLIGTTLGRNIFDRMREGLEDLRPLITHYKGEGIL